MKSHLLSAILFVTFAGACNKKSDAPAPSPKVETGSAAMAAGGSAAPVTPPVGSAAPSTTDTPAGAKPAEAAAATVTLASYDDYKNAGLKLMTQLTDTFKADGTNCDKLGDDTNKVITDNAATFDAVKAYEKAHADDKKKADTDPAMKAQEKAFMDAAGPAMTTCKDNAKLKAAFAKLE